MTLQHTALHEDALRHTAVKKDASLQHALNKRPTQKQNAGAKTDSPCLSLSMPPASGKRDLYT